MIDPLKATIGIAASGLDAQAMRLRIISENVANARSTGSTSGSDPFRRKTVQFESMFDEKLGASSVKVKSFGVDDSPFLVEYDPGNPAADGDGNVKLPNINPIVEMADMREANRSYEAGLQVVKQARSMISQTIDLLRNG